MEYFHLHKEIARHHYKKKDSVKSEVKNLKDTALPFLNST